MAGTGHSSDAAAGGAGTTIPCVTLNSGHAMPVLGFGTGSQGSPADLAAAILHAIRLGHRHLDTAALYRTERAVGDGVADALRLGAAPSRASLFITSKLWITDAHPDLVLPALKESLTKLRLDYLDLFLVHWPAAAKIKDPAAGLTAADLVEFDMEGTWRAMEECQRRGLARSIGVSNFSAAKIDKLMSFAVIPPAVNQVEMNVGWRQERLREACNKHGVRVAAYSPLGAYGAAWGSASVMESAVLRDIAARKGKTVAQVALRWLYEQDVCFVSRSFNRERMKENMEIFDWELTGDERDKIAAGVPQARACNGAHFVSPNGPYKSLEELWDGEI